MDDEYKSMIAKSCIRSFTIKQKYEYVISFKNQVKINSGFVFKIILLFKL